MRIDQLKEGATFKRSGMCGVLRSINEGSVTVRVKKEGKVFDAHERARDGGQAKVVDIKETTQTITWSRATEVERVR